jgi:hypothetical protein
MNSPKPEENDTSDDVSIDDLFAFGTGQADEQLRNRVKDTMSDHRHPLSDLLKPKQKPEDDPQQRKGMNDQSE